MEATILENGKGQVHIPDVDAVHEDEYEGSAVVNFRREFHIEVARPSGERYFLSVTPGNITIIKSDKKNKMQEIFRAEEACLPSYCSSERDA